MTRNNISELENYIVWCYESGVDTVSLNFLRMSPEENRDKNLIPGIDEYIEVTKNLIDKLIELNGKGEKKIYIYEISNLVNKILNPYYDSFICNSPCEAGKRIICLNTDGRIDTVRNSIAYISQETDIMNDTIRNNLNYTQKNISDDDLLTICDKVNIKKRITNGLDEVLSEKTNLSGGEKQRISIARALVKDAQVFIFDEPFAALDAENTAVICKIIEELSQTKSVILISHKGHESLKPQIEYLLDNKTMVLQTGII